MSSLPLPTAEPPELVARTRAGDEGAFAALVKQYQPIVYRWAIALSGGARDHAARCRDCDRTTRVVAERERNMIMAFGDVHQSVPPRHVAERAILLSRRRSVTLYYRIGLAAATVATILVMFLWRLASAPLPAASVSETFRLECLSPEQAAELLRPHIQTTGRVSFRANSPLGIITVEASPEEMEAARSLLGRYDSPVESQCAVQVTVPASAVRPRRD